MKEFLDWQIQVAYFSPQSSESVLTLTAYLKSQKKIKIKKNTPRLEQMLKMVPAIMHAFLTPP
jgi:hypothetical protein